MTIPSRLGRVLAAAATLATLVAGLPALGSKPELVHPVSGISPLAPGCGGAAEGPVIGTEVEPSVAVNPKDPRNVVGVWQQDRFPSHGGARSNVIGYTKDGGATWTTALVPGISECTGGRYERATDPWMSFGPDGTAYMTSLSFDGHSLWTDGELIGPNALLVNRSTDGGATWGPPVTVVADEALILNDKQSITADPSFPGLVYLVWLRFPPFTAFLSRSIDGGITWLPPVPIPAPGQGNQIVVLPDGSLLDVFGSLTYQAIRSLDKGTTWLPPVRIGRATADSVSDPTTREWVRAPNLPTAAVAPGGAVYVAWYNRNAIAFSTSADGGVTWSAARNATSGSVQKFLPTVAVAADGTVGISYYDFRSDTANPDTLLTDVWLTTSRDGGRTWSEQHLSGPFDLKRAPYADGYFVGDYQGLAAAGTSFVPFFSRATPPGAATTTDVYAGLVAP